MDRSGGGHEIQRCPSCKRLVNRAVNGVRCPYCRSETFLESVDAR